MIEVDVSIFHRLHKLKDEIHDVLFRGNLDRIEVE